MLHRLQLSPMLSMPSTDTTNTSTDSDTRGGSRSTVDNAVGEQRSVQVLHHLQLSPMLSTDTATANTDTDTRGGSRSTVDNAVGEQRSM